MARPREYDEEAVRRGAVSAFLHKGYGETSLADLEAATGLDRRQLYNQLGSKRGVFLRALDDFSVEAAERFLSPLEGDPDGVSAIRTTLFAMIDTVDTRTGRLGCLICNTAREAIMDDPEVRERVDRYFQRIEDGYRRALAAEPELDRRRTARLARFFTAIHISLCVMGRAGQPKRVLRDVALEALEVVR